MISREDMLQELELLPVWKLRNATPLVSEVVRSATDEAVAAQAVTQEKSASEIEQAIEPSMATSQFRLVMSDCTQWAFVLPTQHSDEAETLLQNIFKAISIKVSKDIAGANTIHLQQQSLQIIVVMGEGEAQQILGAEQTLEQLRGKAHHYQSVPVIVTYTTSHLLMNLQDKAKAWEDLCLARFTISSL